MKKKISKNINLSYADFVEIEAYDYYGPWDKRAGINAPLMKMDEQYLTEAFMNIVIFYQILTFYSDIKYEINKILFLSRTEQLPS